MVETGVIFLQKDKFDFYQSALGKVIEFRFVPEIVKDLDVINPELLEDLIKLFIANNKIQPSSLVIIIADNACFTKDFLLTTPSPKLPDANLTSQNAIASTPHQTDDAVKEQIDFFIEHVPFDEVVSAKYPLTNGTKAWATNKDLFTTIASSFENQGFDIKGVIPGLVFDGNISSKPVLDVTMANSILQQFDSLREHNLFEKKFAKVQLVENKDQEKLVKPQEVEPSVEVADTPKAGTNKKRLVLMAVVFAILLIIMVVMFITQKPLG